MCGINIPDDSPERHSSGAWWSFNGYEVINKLLWGFCCPKCSAIIMDGNKSEVHGVKLSIALRNSNMSVRPSKRY